MTNTAIRVTEENLPEVVKDFERGLSSELSPKDRDFIHSLINGKHGYFAKGGTLTINQIKWVEILYKRALGVTDDISSETVGDLHGLVALFTEAKANLKYPKIELEINGEPLKLSLAGPKSKYCGSIMITDGGPFGSNKWYGRVTPEGVWTPSNQVTDELRTLISRTLRSFSKDAKHAAMSYGHMSSNCCFCNKPLVQNQSIAAGYGPVCADKWGLPWGDK